MMDGRQNRPISVADLLPERILWPEFFERDGMIFVEDGFDSRVYETSKSSFEAEKQQHVLSVAARLEGILNKRYLKDIFLGTGYIPERKVLEHLGALLEQNWQTKLNLEFPGRNMGARFVKNLTIQDSQAGGLVPGAMRINLAFSLLSPCLRASVVRLNEN